MTRVDPLKHPVRFLLVSLLAVGVWRFVSGQHVLGHRRTNATFIHAGTKAVGAGTQMVKVARWDYLPGWKRMLVRWAAVLVLGLSTFDWFFEHELFVRAAWVIGALVLTLGALLGYRWFRSWQHNRLHVLPLHVVLKNMLGLPDTARADDYITVPRTFATDEKTPARVILPESFNASPDARKLVGAAVLDKLGVAAADVDISFQTVGRPSLLATRAPKPPKTVLLGDVVDIIDKCAPGEILLGLDKRGHAVKVTFPHESPHWGFSCESGTGKSALLACIAAQVLRQRPDNRVVAVDPKIVSLEAIRGLPGVTIVNNPITDEGVVEMWDAVGGVADEVMARAGVLAQDPTATFPMVLLIIDEANLLAALSAPVWERVKPKGDKGKPPIWTHLLKVLAAGRQFGVHVVIVGQDLRESALGGIGLRAMLGLRGIAGYDAQMWSRFMQTRPIPARQSGQGRWCYRIDGADVWVQNVWAGPDPMALVDFVSHVPPSVVSAGESVDTGSSGTVDGPWLVGIDAAAAWLEMSPAAFRKARQRRAIPGETRHGNSPRWTEADLRSWRENALERTTS